MDVVADKLNWRIESVTYSLSKAQFRGATVASTSYPLVVLLLLIFFCFKSTFQNGRFLLKNGVVGNFHPIIPVPSMAIYMEPD